MVRQPKLKGFMDTSFQRYGAMGLNTSILDADALAEALVMILQEVKPLSLPDIYCDQRRKEFRFFVDPTTT